MMRAKISRFYRILTVTAALGLFAAPALAQSVDDIVGMWKIETQMGSNTNESVLTVEKGPDGGITATIGGQRGSIDALNPKFENGVLTYDLKLPQLQGALIQIELTLDGDKLTGVTKSPLGELPSTGSRITEEQLQAEAAAVDAILGDWLVYTDYNGEIMATELRIERDDDDGDLTAVIDGRGNRIYIGRMRFDDNQLSMGVPVPFITEEQARLQLTVNAEEKTMEGSIRTPFGEFPVTAEIIDTEKMVVAPYDDPSQVLGTWHAVTTIQGEAHDTTVELTLNDQKRIDAHIEGPDGTWDATEVNFKKVSDQMSVVRLTVEIPDLGEEPQVFELIVNGDSFEGEELNSFGDVVITGERVES